MFSAVFRAIITAGAVLVVILLLILAVVWIVNTRAEYKAQRAKFEELMATITRVDTDR